MKRLLPAFALLACLPAAGQTLPRGVVEIAKHHLPEVSVAVVADDTLIWHSAFGKADLENEVAATDATRFRLGSVSKPITAVAVMQLV